MIFLVRKGSIFRKGFGGWCPYSVHGRADETRISRAETKSETMAKARAVRGCGDFGSSGEGWRKWAERV